MNLLQNNEPNENEVSSPNLSLRMSTRSGERTNFTPTRSTGSNNAAMSDSALSPNLPTQDEGANESAPNAN